MVIKPTVPIFALTVMNWVSLSFVNKQILSLPIHTHHLNLIYQNCSTVKTYLELFEMRKNILRRPWMNFPQHYRRVGPAVCPKWWQSSWIYPWIDEPSPAVEGSSPAFLFWRGINQQMSSYNLTSIEFKMAERAVLTRTRLHKAACQCAFQFV